MYMRECETEGVCVGANVGEQNDSVCACVCVCVCVCVCLREREIVCLCVCACIESTQSFISYSTN